jgi:hypothetical protein
MSAEVVVAVIAAIPPPMAAVLAFLTTRSVKQLIATVSEIPIGSMVEGLQRQVDALGRRVGTVADRLAHLEGIGVPPFWLDRRVQKMGEDPRTLHNRVASIEGREASA